MSQNPNSVADTRRKLSAKHAQWVMPLILSCIMSAVVSLVNMIKNVGWVEGFAEMWFHAWLWSWLVAFPTVLMVLPVVRRLTALLVDSTKMDQKS